MIRVAYVVYKHSANIRNLLFFVLLSQSVPVILLGFLRSVFFKEDGLMQSALTKLIRHVNTMHVRF